MSFAIQLRYEFMEAKPRVIGFDLARAYAIFGMYIVNYNIVFGNYNDNSWPGKLLSLFSGNSSTVFVILAGMGLALMTNRPNYPSSERSKLRSRIKRRAWFLFGLGLLLVLWWPADILHFYGGYMHIAALLVFLNKKYYLYASALAMIIFHLLLALIPYEKGWNFDTLEYLDFWTVNGFLRNTFYNGWNAVFPWLSYFTLGMYLGRLDWTKSSVRIKMFALGFMLYAVVWILQTIANRLPISEEIKFFINADYLPPFLPFLIGTMGFALMLISFFMYVGKYVSGYKFIHDLARTGQMTLTHYISHLTVGMIVFAFLTGKAYTAKMNDAEPVQPWVIILFATAYFALSFYLSKFWLRKHKHGPFEWLMRKVAGS